MENNTHATHEGVKDDGTRTESRTARLMREIRRTPIFQQLIPQEAGIGWPTPLARDGRIYLKLPFFGFSRDHAKRQTLLFPPFATITLDWENERPVEYINLRFRNPWPGGEWTKAAGVFPHPAIARMTKDQYLTARHELLSFYDALFETMARGASPDAEWAARFGALLHQLVEPPLAPFYRVLGPRFYETFLARSTSGTS